VVLARYRGLAPRMSYMQAPIIIFDHIRKVVAAIPMGPNADKKIAEVLATQRKQVATSGRPQ
jgi:hypothetical protein